MAKLSLTERAVIAARREAVKMGLADVGDRVPKAGASGSIPVKRIRVKEYANLYGVSESTVRSWIRNKRIPFEQPAGKRGRIFLVV